MKIISTVMLFTALLSTSVANAQEVVKTDTLGTTFVSISMDKNISDLMDNMEERCATSLATREADGGSSRPSTIKVPNRELTTAEICRQNPRIAGYKIQVAVVKSNAEANEVKAYFRRHFPSLKVETDASLRPNYKILAGSYFTKQSAAGDLSRIKQFFKNATPVQYRIFCVEAK